MTTIIRSPMERFVRAYGDIGRRSRMELQVSPRDSELRFTVAVLGVMRTQRLLMVAAPRTRDNSLIAVTKGNVMTCQWMNATTAWRFHAVIANLAFEPAPIVYFGHVSQVRHRTLRSEPRALACLTGAVRSPDLHAALVTDLSASGARIGVAGEPGLQIGQHVELAVRPRMFGRDFVLELPATVASISGNIDAEHPMIGFYGLQFGTLDERAELVLHAYVQERLAQETDLLSQLLQAESVDD